MEILRKQLLENIMGAIGELHRHFATSRDVFLAKFKLTRPQMELLFSIKHAQLSTGELAQRFGITSSAVSQMVDQLERKKLVQRVSKPGDRRVTYVTLAPQAHKQFEKLRTQFTEHLSQRFESLTTKELETLLHILTKTVKTMEKEN